MVLCMIITIFPTIALAREASNTTLTVNIHVRAYNPTTQQHEQFRNLKVSTTVKVEEDTNPEYPVSYRFEKETYWGSTSSPYYGEEGWKLIVTIGDVEGDETNGYTCDITVQPDPYVQAYSGVHGDHTLDPADQTAETITLTWDTDSESWTEPEDSIPVIFTVKCTTTLPIIFAVTE